MPSPSVSVSVTGVSATASAGTAVAGSSTAAGSAAGPESGAGAGITSTGASTESTADGAIRVVPDPGAISPHVIVQSPTPAPEVTQLLSILPRMNGPSVFWAEATPLPAMSPTLRPTRMPTRFIATSLVAGIMASRGVDAGRPRQRLKATALLQRVGPSAGFHGSLCGRRPSLRRLRAYGVGRDLAVHGCWHEPETCHPHPVNLLDPQPVIADRDLIADLRHPTQPDEDVGPEGFDVNALSRHIQVVA